ncbi:MAG: RelA/SpoT domain-containing protein [Gammaproteobacteria bacterium]
MTHIATPSLTDIENLIRADLKKIEEKGYSAQQILECVSAYLEQRHYFKDAVERVARIVTDENNADIYPYIHSIRYRTKDPYHLVDKLRRKCLAEKDSRNITKAELFDLKQGVTDLGGVRLLHLYKYEWKRIHNFLVSRKLAPAKLKEMHAYVREDEDKTQYESSSKSSGRKNGSPFPHDGFPKQAISSKKGNYTSLHYIFAWTEGIYYEVQVRTLFEEGWEEIDHQRRYPHGASTVISSQLNALNKAASVADNIASSWEGELAMERASDSVTVLSLDLGWATKFVEKLVKNIKDSSTTYEYLIPEPSGETLFRIETIKNALQDAGLNGRLTFTRVGTDLVVNTSPVFSDLLLLTNTRVIKMPQRAVETKTLAVIGSPVREDVPKEQQVDMLIEEPEHVKKLTAFFSLLKNR